MPSPPDHTWLTITGIGGLPLFSSFNCEQTIDFIEAAKNTDRDLNGTLIDLTRLELRKYTTTITAHDVMVPPGMDGIWPGMPVLINCIIDFVYLIGGTPARPAAPGTTFLTPDLLFYTYKPQLSCLIDSFNSTFDEWGARVGWTMKASEV